MKYLLLTSLCAITAALLPTACTPYPEEPPPTPPADVAQNGPQKPADGMEQAAENERSTSEEKKKPEEGPQITEKIEDPEASKPATKPSTPVARPVPGKPGFVFSPFNNKIIDVKDIPSGTLVADPTYPASEKKYFRVP